MLTTYQRISHDLRNELLEHYRTRVTEHFSKGEVDKKLFAPHEWHGIQNLRNSVAAFEKYHHLPFHSLFEKMSIVSFYGLKKAAHRAYWKKRPEIIL
ncbi:MAG: hypothetical protein GXY67_07080 [Clostridiales bacterium]|nr:hypothetical protein [Clostridiales bacterium]